MRYEISGTHKENRELVFMPDALQNGKVNQTGEELL